MKKINTIHILTLLLIFFTSCKTQQKTVDQNKIKEKVRLTCEMKSCTGPMYLFKFDGYTFVLNQTAELDSNNLYTFNVPSSNHDFYFIGTNKKQTKPIILGKEKDLKLTGNCSNIRQSKFENSPINTEYEKAIGQIRSYQGTANFLNRQYAQAPIGSEKKTSFLNKLKENDQNQMALLSDMRVKYPFVGKIVSTKTFLSFPNNKGNYDNEIQYFVNEYFANIDLSDADLDRMPAIYETFRDYTTTLVAIRFDHAKMKTTLDKVLGKMNPDAKAYRYALGAIIQTLKGKNHPAFTDYANLFVKKYGHEKLNYIAELKSNIRKENPNVVRLYEKYKAQGFDVLGISLDRTKDKWIKAIEKDGLEWHHVSDLKGWKNQVAKQYSVSSIPHTLLLDREGKILARNMRGEQLAVKLKEIFGK